MLYLPGWIKDSSARFGNRLLTVMNSPAIREVSSRRPRPCCPQQRCLALSSCPRSGICCYRMRMPESHTVHGMPTAATRTAVAVQAWWSERGSPPRVNASTPAPQTEHLRCDGGTCSPDAPYAPSDGRNEPLGHRPASAHGRWSRRSSRYGSGVRDSTSSWGSIIPIAVHAMLAPVNASQPPPWSACRSRSRSGQGVRWLGSGVMLTCCG